MGVHVMVVSASGKRATVEADLDDALEDVLVLAEAAMEEPLAGRRVQLQGRAQPLNPAMTLRAHGISGSGAITLMVDQLPAAHRTVPQPAASLDEQIRNLFGGAAPTVAPAPPAASSVDATRRAVEALFGGAGAARAPVAAPQQAFDPDDPEVQRRAYEAIQQRQIEENRLAAIEETPEAFGTVVMLYVHSTVNGVPVAAFIDSGAQMTVMSARVAEQCNLTRLIDRRFQGVAKGVGSTRIIGRIHMAQVRLGPLDDKVNCVFLPMSITVVEQDGMDFLIGLDQLRRHRMCIDLTQNALRLPDMDKSFNFLSEHELPDHIRTNVEEMRRSASGILSDGAPATSTPGAPATSLTAEKAAAVQSLRQMLPDLPEPIAVATLEAADWDVATAAALLTEG